MLPALPRAAAAPPAALAGPRWAAELASARTLHASPVPSVTASARVQRPPRPAPKTSRLDKPGVPELLPPPQRIPEIKDVPNTSTRSTLSRYLSPGKLVEFRYQDGYILGLVVREDEGEGVTRVTNVDRQLFDVHKKQVSVVLPGKGYKLADLRDILNKVEGMDVHKRLQEVWRELTAEAAAKAKGRAVAAVTECHYDVLKMSRKMWQATNSTALYATHRALTEDTLLFFRLKTRPPTYHVRDEAEVQRLQQQRLLEAELAAQRARLKRALQDALARDPPPQNNKDEWMHGRHAEAIVHLMEFAKGEVGQPHGNALYALLDTEYEVSTEGAARLLKAIGFWPRHVPTVVLREQIDLSFPEYLDQAARELNAKGPLADRDAAAREADTRLSLAIDDITTSEVDDAITVETLPQGGWRVTVHVADPSAILRIGEPLDLEALKRGRTLYLPWTKAPMFPSILAEDVFSLARGEPCPTLAFIGDVAPNGQLSNGHIKMMTASAQRVTYDQADDILAGGLRAVPHGDELKKLVRDAGAMAAAREAHRKAKGAVDIPNMECVVRVADLPFDAAEADLAIDVHVIAPHESPSRLMVKEAMVLAGEIAALWGAEYKIPMLYRSQEAPVPPTQAQLAALGNSQYAIGYMWRTRMLRSTTTADAPRKHNALGVDAYCQVTSPIRRYSDLMCHYQIKAQLEGRSLPFSAATLDGAYKRIEDRTRKHGAIEASVRDHFLAIHLKRHPGKSYSGEILAAKNGKALVQITDLGLEVEASVPGAVNVGQRSTWDVEIVESTGEMQWSDAEAMRAK